MVVMSGPFIKVLCRWVSPLAGVGVLGPVNVKMCGVT